MGRMADFPPPVTFSVSDLENHEGHEIPQINSQSMWNPLMNLVNATLSQKYGDPKLKVSVYGSALKSSL